MRLNENPRATQSDIEEIADMGMPSFEKQSIAMFLGFDTLSVDRAPDVRVVETTLMY